MHYVLLYLYTIWSSYASGSEVVTMAWKGVNHLFRSFRTNTFSWHLCRVLQLSMGPFVYLSVLHVRSVTFAHRLKII
jgi:hypothetical protein